MNDGKILILGAFEPEVAPLREWAGTRAGLAIAVTGVGMASAAAGAARALALHQPARLLFIGSVGCTAGAASLFQLVTATKAVLADRGLASGEAFLPTISAREYEADARWRALVASSSAAAQAPIYSASGITATDDLAAELTRYAGASFESMELFGVAAACAAFEVPWVSISCVTNYLGPRGHAEWLENHSRAAALTAEAIRSLFESKRG